MNDDVFVTNFNCLQHSASTLLIANRGIDKFHRGNVENMKFLSGFSFRNDISVRQ